MIIRLTILVIILLFFSCVSKSKFTKVVKQKGSLEKKLVDTDKRLKSIEKELQLCKKEVKQILETSGSSPDWALITSVQNKTRPLFECQKICKIQLLTQFSQIGSSIKNGFETRPINGILRSEQLINNNTRKWLFISDGYSQILKSNPRYETVVYIVSLYFDSNSNRFTIDIDYLPMVAGGKDDKRVFLSDETQINLYSIAVNNVTNSIINTQLKINTCLKRI